MHVCLCVCVLRAIASLGEVHGGHVAWNRGLLQATAFQFLGVENNIKNIWAQKGYIGGSDVYWRDAGGLCSYLFGFLYPPRRQHVYCAGYKRVGTRR